MPCEAKGSRAPALRCRRERDAARVRLSPSPERRQLVRAQRLEAGGGNGKAGQGRRGASACDEGSASPARCPRPVTGIQRRVGLDEGQLIQVRSCASPRCVSRGFAAACSHSGTANGPVAVDDFGSFNRPRVDVTAEGGIAALSVAASRDPRRPRLRLRACVISARRTAARRSTPRQARSRRTSPTRCSTSCSSRRASSEGRLRHHAERGRHDDLYGDDQRERHRENRSRRRRHDAAADAPDRIVCA